VEAVLEDKMYQKSYTKNVKKTDELSEFRIIRKGLREGFGTLLALLGISILVPVALLEKSLSDKRIYVTRLLYNKP